ncbi:MAG: Gfo/Idh/MocA family oxidoreductase [Gammaproteobacteria bacterium]|nr:Gfo/Idh/MocA family oxidoreductase [Gammaproteobacteria bacterium]MYF30331.1 Gfo/Idh/MocA family oxidoreductase [Gammaproteobacteria bacterium]MYK46274.1 Gfo/Idh/MocA family oxidoreductase [Gammaproteobacteria bacterium]
MPKKRLSVALIGAGGNMRNAHMARIAADGAVEIAGVADPVESQARLLMERARRDLPYFPDWRRMLDDVDVDGVLISTPHREHYRQAKASLERGRHVLVEKPLVIRPEDAKRLLALAAGRRLALVVAYQRHWMPHFAYARELVERGAVGAIRGVVAYVTQNWLRVGGWRLDPDLAGGGMFMDTGSHLLAAMLWVTGLQPKVVSASFDNIGRAVDVNGGVVVEFSNDAIGTLTTTGNALHHDERLAISGSEGSLVLHLHRWRVRSMLLNDEVVELPKRIKPSTPDAALFRWMRSGLAGYEPQDFALQVARLTEAAYRAADERRPVKVRR